MTPNLPTQFLEELRYEVIDETSYSDNELYTFTKLAIKRIDPLLRTDVSITDGASVYDYTVAPVLDSEYWEVVKYATLDLVLSSYHHKLIAQGVGISISIGAEKIDTKTLLNTTNDLLKQTKKTLKGKILAYNLLNVKGVSIDLYVSDEV